MVHLWLCIDVISRAFSTRKRPCFSSLAFFFVCSRATYGETMWIWPRSFCLDLDPRGEWHSYGWLHNHQLLSITVDPMAGIDDGSGMWQRSSSDKGWWYNLAWSNQWWRAFGTMGVNPFGLVLISTAYLFSFHHEQPWRTRSRISNTAGAAASRTAKNLVHYVNHQF